MKIKWQWFLGGRAMFWISIIMFIILTFGFIATYLIDPTTTMAMKVQKIDPTVIENISKKYVADLRYKN